MAPWVSMRFCGASRASRNAVVADWSSTMKLGWAVMGQRPRLEGQAKVGLCSAMPKGSTWRITSASGNAARMPAST